MALFYCLSDQLENPELRQDLGFLSHYWACGHVPNSCRDSLRQIVEYLQWLTWEGEGANARGTGLQRRGSDVMHASPPACPPPFFHVLEGWSNRKPFSFTALRSSNSWRNVVPLQLCSSASFLHILRGGAAGSQLALPCFSSDIRWGEHLLDIRVEKDDPACSFVSTEKGHFQDPCPSNGHLPWVLSARVLPFSK